MVAPTDRCKGEPGLCQQVLGKGREQLEPVGQAGTCEDVGPAECALGKWTGLLCVCQLKFLCVPNSVVCSAGLL